MATNPDRRDIPQPPETVPGDKYARESFTWRRMKTWQIGVVIAAVVIGLIWVLVA